MCYFNFKLLRFQYFIEPFVNRFDKNSLRFRFKCKERKLIKMTKITNPTFYRLFFKRHKYIYNYNKELINKVLRVGEL